MAAIPKKSESPLIASALARDEQVNMGVGFLVVGIGLSSHTYQGGSDTRSLSLKTLTRQLSTRAQIESKFATGPKVAETSGKPVDCIQNLLQRHFSSEQLTHDYYGHQTIKDWNY